MGDDAPLVVHYTPLGQALTRRRQCSKKVVMLILGVTGITILATLLQVFLLPFVSAQSDISTSGNNYTSPGVYPARKTSVPNFCRLTNN
jgi:hypothetical protein